MGAVRGTQRRIEKEEERGIGREADRKGKGIGLRESKEGERERERERKRKNSREGNQAERRKRGKDLMLIHFPGCFLASLPSYFSAAVSTRRIEILTTRVLTTSSEPTLCGALGCEQTPCLDRLPASTFAISSTDSFIRVSATLARLKTIRERKWRAHAATRLRGAA